MSPIVTRLVRTLFVAAAFAALGPATPAPAAAAECSFLREDGTTRDCTFTERVGKCYYEAYESYFDCVEWSTTALGRLRCELAVQIDLAACTLNVAGEVGRLVNPF